MAMTDRAPNYGRHHIEHFLRKVEPFDAVMDLGAGWGYDLEIAQRVNPEARMIGLELAPSNLSVLKKKGIEALDVDLERDALPAGANIIIANHVLSQIKNTPWVLHEVSRILPVGGYFLVGVPNLASMQNRLRLALGKQPTVMRFLSTQFRGFTKQDILEGLETDFPGGYSLQGFAGDGFYPFSERWAKAFARLFPNAADNIYLLLRKDRDYN